MWLSYIVNNYSPLAIVSDTEEKSSFQYVLKQRDNIHQKKIIWMISSLFTDANRYAIFFPSCSGVNSKGYSEFD